MIDKSHGQNAQVDCIGLCPPLPVHVEMRVYRNPLLRECNNPDGGGQRNICTKKWPPGLCRIHDMPKKMQDLEFVPSTFMSVLDVENSFLHAIVDDVIFNFCRNPFLLVHDQ